MHWYEPLIIIAAVSFVGLVIFLHFYLKKKGKSLGGDCGCNGNCKKCGHQCSSCDKLLKEYRETYSKE
jgi:hypothetical protein